MGSASTRCRADQFCARSAATDYCGDWYDLLRPWIRDIGCPVSEAQEECSCPWASVRNPGRIPCGASFFGNPRVHLQFCQFHQIAIVRRYLTSRPKLPAGRELRAMALALPTIAEQTFTNLLAIWHKRWEQFLKERTYTPNSRRFQYTHRRIRSAYRSLKTNTPYLFTYQKYPHLHIPNTTNSIDGFFSKLKHLLNTHRGLTIQRRYKLIQEILGL